MWLVIIIVVSILYLLYKSFNKYDYWKNRQVPNPKTLPLLGNMKTLLFQQEAAIGYFGRIYKKYPDDPYVGIYKINQPALFLRDPDLIKDVLIKDFSSFHDNDLYVTKSDLFAQNPFILKGEEWKTARAQITPSLTPVKLKGMFETIEDISNKLLDCIEHEGLGKDIEGKHMCTKFTTDNFTSCAFGINGNSFNNPGNNDLFVIGNSLLSTNSYWLGFIDFCLFMKPAWSKIFKPKFFTTQILDYFANTVRETNQYRTDNNIFRNDFFDFINATVQKVHTSKVVQEEQIAVHAATLYIDGVETSGITLAFVLYELAKHPEIQEKLREEILEMLDVNDNKLNYEALTGLEYLDCVISESLRLHPPVPHMTRRCTKEYTFQKTERNPRELTIEVGTPVIIPITSIHYDEKYYPNSTEFDPDRFMEGTKLDNPKCTYMPFGEGPRICIGRRYGMLQVRIGLAKILSTYRVLSSTKTREPIKLKAQFFLTPIDGLWLTFEKLRQ